MQSSTSFGAGHRRLRGVSGPNRGARLETPEKAEKPEQERSAQRTIRLAVTDRNDRREAIGTVRRIVLQSKYRAHAGQRKSLLRREKAARVSGAERASDRRGGNRAVPENERWRGPPGFWKAGAV
ncbi:MAG: hypothetical protein ACLR8P_23290 [Clostridium fessum]